MSGNAPTLTLPLAGEGTINASPCQGGGWEGGLVAPISETKTGAS